MVYEQTPVMTLRSDRNVLESSLQNQIAIPRNIISAISDGKDHSLMDFLARPQFLATVTWTTAAAAGSFLTGYDLPSFPLTLRVFAAKVVGHQFFRGTTVIRIMINAQRFQAGRLLMTWMPLVKQNETKYNDTKFLTYFTQRPRAEFDLSTDTEVVMKIPYVHPALAFDLGSGFNDAGRLDFVVYGALSSGSVQVNVYVSFEDVELGYANEPGTFIAQSGRVPVVRRSRPKIDPSDAEAKDMKVSPVSSMLSSLATTARFGTQIPLISSVAGPVAWAASLAANAAHAFGYSKPLMLAPRMKTYSQTDTHRMNCDGAHMAVNMGLFEDNRVRHAPGFAGTDVDEMAISNIVGTYAYCFTINWPSTSVEGVPLLSAYPLSPNTVGPATRTAIVGGTSSTVYDLIPLSYLASLFYLYRGSIKIKFKVVKTEFHSGRLRFNYALNSVQGAGNNPPYSSANVHSTIIDLRDSTEFEFTIPYGSSTPYLPYYSPYAAINLYVETPLLAPPTVANNVDILVEIAGADDFEFASPLPFSLTPWTTALGPVEAQSGHVSDAGGLTEQLSEPVPVGGASTIQDSGDSSEHCIGEKILSLRQLLKRHTRFMALARIWGQVTTGTNWYQLPDVTLHPASIVLPNPIQAGPTVTSAMCHPDYFTFFGVLFAQHRGSIRLSHELPSTPRNTMGTNTAYPATSSSWPDVKSSPLKLSLVRRSATDNIFPTITSVNSFLPDRSGTCNTSCEDIQVPYYSQTVSSINLIGPWVTFGAPVVPTKGPKFCLPSCTNVLVTSNLWATGTSPTVPAYSYLKRAIGEDFSFGYFTGTYPLVGVTRFNTA